MKNGFESDMDFTRKFKGEIIQIIAPILIDEAPATEDATHNTDFMVLQTNGYRIASRIRRYSDANGRIQSSIYGNEYTIRCSRPNGTKTELQKIIEGWGDFMLYGFASENEERLCRWFVGDLSVFRRWLTSFLITKKQLPGIKKPNTDGSSEFYVYNLNFMPKDFLVSCSWQRP